MPIQGFSSAGRWDRIGKIRIGMRVENPQRPGTTIPRAVDYFVCPPEVQEVYGEKPKLLYPIMFPSDNPDEWMSHFYRCYSASYSLVCMGDGVTSSQKTDKSTGAMVDRNTKEGDWEWKDGLTCAGPECPLFLNRSCRPIMRLQFFLPEVPGGIGVYEVSTTSYYSRANFDRTINAVRNMALKLTGTPRIGLVPLGLALGPQEVNPPGQKRKIVQIMHLTTGKLKLGDFLRALQIAPAQVFALPQPIAQTPQEAELEEPPGDLLGPYGDEPVGGQTEAPAETPTSSPCSPPAEPPTTGPKGQPKPKVIKPVPPKTPEEQAALDATVKAAADKAAANLGQRETGTELPPEQAKEQLKLRKELNKSLLARFHGVESDCKQWLEANFHTVTSEVMGLAELRTAIERSKEAAAGESEPTLF